MLANTTQQGAQHTGERKDTARPYIWFGISILLILAGLALVSNTTEQKIFIQHAEQELFLRKVGLICTTASLASLIVGVRLCPGADEG